MAYIGASDNHGKSDTPCCPAKESEQTHQLNITLDFFHKSQARKVLDNPHHYNLQ